MDNKELNPEDEELFSSLLDAPELEEEITPDEQAISSAGLTNIEDFDLERIIQEAIAGEFGSDPIEETANQISQHIPLDDLYSDDELPTSEPEAQPEIEPEVESEPEDPNEPVRKVRPKRKSGYGLLGIPHLISIAIWFALAVFIGVSIGNLMWVCASDVLAFGRPDMEITLTITERDTMDDIINKLYNSGLIKYPSIFKIYAELSHADKKISTGTFTLNTLYDYHAVVSGLSASSSYRESITVMIPEGYTCAQIYALLESKGVCSVESLENYASQSEFESYGFLEGVERGSKYCLEGYLFPDTYEFYLNSSPQQVFIKLLSRFDNQFDIEMRDRLTTLNERLAAMMRSQGYGSDYIESHLMTIHDVMIVASMIEKESAGSAESYTVSSVIYNRLASPQFPFLNIDATIVYALGGKKELTSEDLNIDSPYNTYLVEGLPPTPISNPGKTSIGAALTPADTTYYYYALNPATGMHHFSNTYKEHQDFLESIK